MNERIKELYQQAHMVREYPEDDPMRGSNPPTVYWGDERSAEKFAELLIRECMSVARGMRNPPNLNYKPSDRFVDELRLHFGVKE
jgi:hypothetical protein